MVRLALYMLCACMFTACGGGEPDYPIEWTATYAEQAANHRVLYVPYPWLLQGRVIYPDTVLTICQFGSDAFNFGSCPTKTTPPEPGQ